MGRSRRLPLWLIGAAALAAVGCSRAASADDTAASRTAADPAEAECIDPLVVDHHDSVLQEQRSVGPPAADFQERFAAEEIDPATHAPVNAVTSYRLGGKPLLWFTPDRTAAVVDAAVLSDLQVADPTRMKPGEGTTVGVVAESARDRISHRDLAEFLVRAGVIRTYWHIGSILCLEEEVEKKNGYEARFSGAHTYYTSEQHVDRFEFTLRIGNDGSIRVTAPLRSPRGGAAEAAKRLAAVQSESVIRYDCDEEVEAGHLAALEWFDANRVAVGAPASEIRDFLSRALVRKRDRSDASLVIYKFPLAPPAGNDVLDDEPRAQYDHYFVSVHKRTDVIEKKGFRRYSW